MQIKEFSFQLQFSLDHAAKRVLLMQTETIKNLIFKTLTIRILKCKQSMMSLLVLEKTIATIIVEIRVKCLFQMSRATRTHKCWE